MAESYGLQNAIGNAAGIFYNATIGSNAGYGVAAGYTATASKSIIPTTGIGSDSASGRTIYAVAATFGDLVISEFWVSIGGTVSASTAPVLKFWRRADATKFNVDAGGSGDTAIYKADGTTADTMTIPTSGPTPIAGNVYVKRFSGNTVINPGEAFIVELDVAGDAATTAILGHVGYYSRFNADSVQSSAGAAKPNTNAVGRVYVVTA